MPRLALQLAEAAPAVTTFGPVAGIAFIVTTWLARFRPGPAA